MKIFYTTSAVIASLIIGFIIPLLIVTSGTPEPVLFEWHMVGKSEPIGMFFVASKIIPNLDNQYPNHFKGSEQIIVQTYTWMMIPHSVIEYCIYSRDKYGEITDLRSIGTIKKVR